MIYHWSDLKPFVLSLNPWNKNEYLVYDAVSIRIERVVNVTDTITAQSQHYEKMKAYKQIPRWWYYAVLACAYGIAQASTQI